MRARRYFWDFLKIIIIFSISYASAALASDKGISSLGDAAINALEPAIIVASALHFIYLIVGTSFVAASVIKFLERRTNPLGVTIGQILFLLIAGLFILALPYILNQSSEGLSSTIFPTIFETQAG